MARTLFGTGDAGTPKRWSTKALSEIRKKSYFISRMAGSEDQLLPVVLRNDLESGPGDEVTVYLVAKIQGLPIQGNEKAEGREKRLTDYTDKIRIDRMRMPVNVGDIMAQKRRPYSLRTQATARISDFWAEYIDEELFAHAAGTRGTGRNFHHIPVGHAGWPQAYVAPDADHLVYPGSVTAKTGITSSTVVSRAFVEKLTLKAETMIGGRGPNGPNAFRMERCAVEGARYWVYVMHPANMYDLRSEVGEAGWLALEKARALAVGSNSPIFKGEAGAAALLNQTILHQHTNIPYSDDYGGGSVRGFRTLFMGAHGLAMAFGTKERKVNGVRLELDEAKVDLGDETVVKSMTITGMKKTQYDNRDFAIIAGDVGCSAAALAAMNA